MEKWRNLAITEKVLSMNSQEEQVLMGQIEG